jgi:ParB family chromosome partitioning protein
LDQIERGRYQPRTEMDPTALEELAASIRAQGVVQPIVVRPRPGGERYEIIAGERRWRAAQMAGLDHIPAVVREVADQAAIAIALIENIQREDLNPVEEARALNRLIEEFALTHQETADAVGRSRSAVTNLLRLLEIAPEASALLENGDIEMGHARALLALPRDQQGPAARQVVARGLSVRETERLVHRLLQAPAEARVARPLNADTRRLQDDLAARLGAVVQIHHSARGKGRLVIQYNNLEELDGILAHIR